MPPSPSGVVTLVFTDIEGSSALSERHGDRFELARAEYFQLLREEAGRFEGYEVRSTGDGLFLAFARATSALLFAVEVQRSCVQREWTVGPLRTRIGIHSGEPFVTAGTDGVADYFGPPVNRAARVVDAGHGDQILLSTAARELLQNGLCPEIGFKDLGIHRLRDIGEERMWQVLHPALPSEFPPLRALWAGRLNLPVPPTPFLGREDEVPGWEDLLALPQTRVLTLTGFGGIGKTRCAIHLSERCGERFVDRIWWVSLDQARDAEQMVQRIATALKLHPQPNQTAAQQLHGFLNAKQLLLVLDNTEQIAGAGQAIAELLDHAREVKCLATSRKPLGIQGERVIELGPLVPETAESLFIERARSHRYDFEVTPEAERDIRELCRKLEGIPLAIELAASRIAALTPAELLERLTEKLPILRSPSSNVPVRQRALRETIDWSYELLSTANRDVLARLSIFAGSFTLRDAEAVCDQPDVLESLIDLKTHSLLSAERDATGRQTRYSMLEVIREYAAERLSQTTDNGIAIRERHFTHFLKVADDERRSLRTLREPVALDNLATIQDNIRSALQWALHSNKLSEATRLSLALHAYLFRRGFWAEARDCLESVIPKLDTGFLPELAEIKKELAGIAADTGNLNLARELAKECLALCREMPEFTSLPEALNMCAYVAIIDEDFQAAAGWLEEALSLANTEDHARLGIIHHNRARLASKMNRPADARRTYEVSLEHRRTACDLRGQAETLLNLGVLDYGAGDLDGAARRYFESLELSQRLQHPYGIAVALNNLGETLLEQAAFERAAPLLLRAERIFTALQCPDQTYPRRLLRGIAEKLGQDRYELLQESAPDWREELSNSRV